MSSQNQKLDSEILENQGPQEPEIEISGKGCDLRFEEVNEVTWKLTDGRGSNAWRGDRGGSYRTTRAVGWLMGVGNGQWIFRYRNRASRPMRLNAVKRYALEMVRGVRPGRVLTDPIRNLHGETRKALEEVDREVHQGEPVDLMGGTRRGVIDPELRQAILDIELNASALEASHEPALCAQVAKRAVVKPGREWYYKVLDLRSGGIG
jgi:hypothetical protein